MFIPQHGCGKLHKKIEEGNSLWSILSIIAGAVCVAATWSQNVQEAVFKDARKVFSGVVTVVHLYGIDSVQYKIQPALP